MAVLKSKKVILPLVVLLIVAGAGAVFAFKDKGSDQNESTNNNNVGTKPPTQTEAKLYTTTEVLADVNTYKDQIISLRGSIVHIEGEDYYLAGAGAEVDPNKPSALKLDFSKTDIDPSQYANLGSREKGEPSDAAATEIKPPVTVTGKLTQSDPEAEPYLEVTSVY